MQINSEIYDVLKWVANIVLPALAVLYGTIGDVWGLPYTDEIPLTIIAIQVFLSSLLGLSSVNYYKSQAELSVQEDANQG